jgi:hypothetical protein
VCGALCFLVGVLLRTIFATAPVLLTEVQPQKSARPRLREASPVKHWILAADRLEEFLATREGAKS